MDSLLYRVPGMACEHCTRAVETEVARLPAVASVEAELEGKVVRVHGEDLEDADVRAAIAEAGYEAA